MRHSQCCAVPLLQTVIVPAVCPADCVANSSRRTEMLLNEVCCAGQCEAANRCRALLHAASNRCSCHPPSGQVQPAHTSGVQHLPVLPEGLPPEADSRHPAGQGEGLPAGCQGGQRSLHAPGEGQGCRDGVPQSHSGHPCRHPHQL